MKRGDQIAYIPDHAKEEGVTHKDVEFGFVSSVSPYDNEIIFCRYWSKFVNGQLRTTANSEATNIRDLVPYKSMPDELVQSKLKEIERRGQM
jgi:hypothetical protein